jgi:hypothetical protein
MLNLAASAVLAAALALGAPRAGDLPYEALGTEFLKAYGLQPGADLEAILNAGFARFELGAFELYYPRAGLADEAAAARFQRACLAVLDAQGTWVDWADPGEERVPRKENDADLKTVHKWIEGWKEKDLGAVPAGRELGSALPGKDKDQAALLRFNASLAGAALPAEEGKPAARARFVLVPDRKTFVPFAAALGLMREDLRSVYWVPDAVGWVEFRYEETRIAALEFAGLDPMAWDVGLPMDARNEQGLEQQIAQLAFGSLLLERFGNRIDPDFSNALCNNLVIELYGQVDTRSDGDLRPRTAPSRKIFVPGGLSQGGVLPPNNADSPWREGKGKDRFVGVLAEAQKAGAKAADDKAALNAFGLLSEDTTQTYVARAPFFGAAAAATAVPPEVYRGNWLELQRCYRVAFCHWLREHGAGSKPDSAKAFGAFLVRLSPDKDVDFAAELEQAFGAPISAAPPGSEDLEGRFLAWLSKQKK